MSAERPQLFSPRLVIGLFILTFGTLVLLENMDMLDAVVYLRRLWPIGFLALAAACWLAGSRVAAAVSAAIGLLLGAHALGYRTPVDLGDLIVPGALIALGVVVLRRAFSRGPAAAAPGSDASGDTVSGVAIFGSAVRRSNSSNFRGGDWTAVFGGAELDLTEARTAPQGAVLDFFVMFGGAEIRVPTSFKVVSEVTPILGGFEDKTRFTGGEATSELRIRGTVLFGGIEVKN